MTDSCPCSSGKKYLDCCGIFIEGKKLPETPEQLMRSRYSAYTRANIDYIEQTMQGPAAKNFNKKEAYQWAKTVKWDGLQVIQAHSQNDTGQVEFIAHYSFDNKQYQLHEISEFVRKNGRWFYVDGELIECFK